MKLGRWGSALTITAALAIAGCGGSSPRSATTAATTPGHSTTKSRPSAHAREKRKARPHKARPRPASIAQIREAYIRADNIYNSGISRWESAPSANASDLRSVEADLAQLRDAEQRYVQALQVIPFPASMRPEVNIELTSTRQDIALLDKRIAAPTLAEYRDLKAREAPLINEGNRAATALHQDLQLSGS